MTTARLLASALVTAAVAAVVGAPPALAADCSTVEPATTPYQLRISPSYAQVKAGTTVVLYTRLVRDGRECGPDSRIGVWTRGQGQTAFRLSRTGGTDARGLMTASFAPRADFRWYTNHVHSGSEAARSTVGLVQIR